MLFKYLTMASALAITGLSFSNVSTPTPPESPEATFKTLCSSCHGDVQAFVDRKWKHGTRKEDLIASISKGYADFGMPAWEGTLKPDQIEGIAQLIQTSIEKGNRYSFSNKPKSNIFKTEAFTARLDTVASGLDNPWGMSFLPDGNLLVTDRNGKIYRIDSNQQKTEINGGPEVLAQGQGGLLDVTLHPNFSKNHWVYFSYSAFKEAPEGKLSTTAVMRAKLDGNQLSDQKVIFEALPYSKTRHHYGSRMVFDKNGYLFVSVGERGSEKTNPQNLDSDLGKIHRMKDDGSPVNDNPFKDKTKGTIYSWGHRNPQGLLIDPATGTIWETEHGPRGGDELNIVRKGANYGWPVISYGINYDGKVITDLKAKEGMEQAQKYWVPSIAPSGLALVNSSKYPAWKGNLLIGSLRFKYLNRCVIKNNKVVKEEILFPNIGRVRNVSIGPDGYAYVAVEDPGYIYRIAVQ